MLGKPPRVSNRIPTGIRTNFISSLLPPKRAENQLSAGGTMTIAAILLLSCEGWPHGCQGHWGRHCSNPSKRWRIRFGRDGPTKARVSYRAKMSLETPTMTTPASAIKDEVRVLIDVQIETCGQPALLTSSQLREFYRRSEKISTLCQELNRIGTGSVMERRTAEAIWRWF
jgi:hypothetical protein